MKLCLLESIHCIFSDIFFEMILLFPKDLFCVVLLEFLKKSSRDWLVQIVSYSYFGVIYIYFL